MTHHCPKCGPQLFDYGIIAPTHAPSLKARHLEKHELDAARMVLADPKAKKADLRNAIHLLGEAVRHLLNRVDRLERLSDQVRPVVDEQ